MVERCIHIADVGGSNPPAATMKKQLSPIFLLPLFLVSETATNKIETKVTQQGSGQVQVQTNVNSQSSQSVTIETNGKVEKKESGTTKTRREVDVNGQKKIVESDKPGLYSVEYKNGNYTTQTQATDESKKNNIVLNTDTISYIDKIKTTSLSDYIHNQIQSIFNRLKFRFFGR